MKPVSVYVRGFKQTNKQHPFKLHDNFIIVHQHIINDNIRGQMCFHPYLFLIFLTMC